MSYNAVALSPHPDDIAIGIGGTVTALSRKGRDVRIINMTDGRHGNNEKHGEKITPEDLVKIRQSEDKLSNRFMSTESSYLEVKGEKIEDGTLNNTVHEPDIVATISRKLSRLDPDMLFLPDRGDHHPDHRATHRIGMTAVKMSDANPAIFYYSVWRFPFGKYNPSELENLVVIDVDDHYTQKLNAIKSHQSQDFPGSRLDIDQLLGLSLGNVEDELQDSHGFFSNMSYHGDSKQASKLYQLTGRYMGERVEILGSPSPRQEINQVLDDITNYIINNYPKSLGHGRNARKTKPSKFEEL